MSSVVNRLVRPGIHMLVSGGQACTTAFQFLTSIPLPIAVPYTKKIVRRSVIFYPLVGAVIGLLLALAGTGLHHVLPILPAGVLIVILWAALSGGLHLDGLLDTADGVFSHRPRERMLEIMKDSRVGAMGVITCVLALLLKVSLVIALMNPSGTIEKITRENTGIDFAMGEVDTQTGAGIATDPGSGSGIGSGTGDISGTRAGIEKGTQAEKGTDTGTIPEAAAAHSAGHAFDAAGPNGRVSFALIMLVPIWSRWFMVSAIAFWPYARQDQGLGSVFRDVRLRHVLCSAALAMILTLPAALLLGATWQQAICILSGLLILSAGAGSLLALYLYRKLGGLTGDTYGALNEVLEVVLLLGLALWLK